MQQFNEDQAIAFAKSEAWKNMDPKERAAWQLEQELLCMPFQVFQESVEEALGRPVLTHEFANRAALRLEMEGKAKPPTFAQILAMLPQGKTVVVVCDKDQ